MSQSLRDQLLKAGLVSEKEARQAERESSQQHYKQGKQAKKGPAQGKKRAPPPDLAAKAARDRELNRQRQARIEAKAREAELRRLIEQLRLPKPDSDDYFNFVDGGKVRRIPVDAGLRERISRGEVLIARSAGRYDLLPASAAERIRERDPGAILRLDQGSAKKPQDEDWYRGFDVPDDLVW